jgi:hypothetical protein
METICVTAERAVRLNYATLFLVTDGRLSEWISRGERIVSLESAQFSLTKREMATFIVAKQGPVPQTPSLFSARPADAIICCNPISNSKNEIVAMLELGCGFSGSPGDCDVIESFVRRATTLLSQAGLARVIDLGQEFLAIGEHFPGDEADRFDTPWEYKLDVEPLLKFDFSAKKLPLPETFKVVFAVLDFFGLKTEFGITNRQLYTFLRELASRYRSDVYFNWAHAIETCQFCAFQLSLINKAFSKQEILTLLLAALCHDVDHDGFANNLPIDALYQTQSIYEGRHVLVASSVLGSLGFFQANPKYWELFVDLVLATDMSKHFPVIHELADRETFDFNEEEFCRCFLKVILKVADVCDCCKPFAVANSVREDVCEEFFQQGFLEGVDGLIYQADRKNRAELVKAASFLAFYQEVCFPMLSILDKICEELVTNSAQLEINIRSWKEETNTSLGTKADTGDGEGYDT